MVQIVQRRGETGFPADYEFLGYRLGDFGEVVYICSYSQSKKMGVISTIHCVDALKLEAILDSPKELAEYLDQNSPIIEESGRYFSENKFDTNKAWNPTYRFINIYLLQNEVDNFRLRPIQYFTHNEVKKLWMILNRYSQDEINKIVVNKEVIKNISLSAGYRMTAIEDSEIIIENIRGIIEIFRRAVKQKKAIYIETE